MTVQVKGLRQGVEISWDPSGFGGSGGSPSEPEQPVDGFPTHPIYLPPYVDIGFPADQPIIDNSLPEGGGDHIDNSLPLPGGPVDPDYGVPVGGEHPDNTLPGDLPHVDNSLPGDQPVVSLPIYLPPYVNNALPGAVKEAVKEALRGFATGNLPEYVAPHGGQEIACQVFAQGQDGDWSNTAVQPNDGKALLSFPEGFTGESWVEVRGLTGTVIDCGTITVGSGSGESAEQLPA